MRKWRCLLGLGLLAIAGCRSLPAPAPEDTLPAAGDGDTAYYRFQERGASYSREDLLGQVFFDFDQSNLLPPNQNLLKHIAAELQTRAGRSVTVIGYSDWHGKEGYNLSLGQKRAEAVAAFLQKEGIDGARVRTESRGAKDSPIGLSKGDAYFDRRVDLLYH